MRAVVRKSTGMVLVDDYPKPKIKKGDDVLVEVKAAAINPVDYKAGKLILGPIVGLDFSGIVVEIGSKVTSLSIGDRVYGTVRGSLADFCVVKEGRAAKMAEEMSFSQAAAMPTAYVTGCALRRARGAGLKDAGLGASGGCGLAGDQIAKALGASEIVGVCSGKNERAVLDAGGTSVIDYKKTNISEACEAGHFDQVYDCATGSGKNENYFDEADALIKKGGLLVTLNGGAGTWLRYFTGWEKNRRKLILTNMNTSDLNEIASLFASGKVRPLIAHNFGELSQASVDDAFERQKSRRTVGKLVFTISSS